jgi:hypothetical protein
MKIYSEEMAPFHIDVDSYNHTVLKDTGKYDNDNELIMSSEGYYSTLDGALRKIIKEKTRLKHENDLVHLRDYLKTFREITEQITNLNLK